ncbi:MAG: hypothetical protein PF572_04500 [Patescibacteria group bacterium]|jgi:uncharacterized lipoprotein YehR (DUF1307 family)|nr:hypothetical protein [Patescibacteria group bacterium]
MNKKIVITLLLVLALSLSACSKKEEEKQVENNIKEGGMQVLEKKTLKDWFSGDKVVECTIKSPEGDVVVTTRGEDSYMEGVPYISTDSQGEMSEATNGAVLTVGDWTYMWDKDIKKGTKMNMKELDERAGVIEEEYESDDGDFDSMAEEWEDSGFEYDCKEVKNSDSLFEEPKDVEFQNLNDMMGGIMDTSNKIQEQIDMGEEIDMEELNMEELEKMMQGFQQ